MTRSYLLVAVLSILSLAACKKERPNIIPFTGDTSLVVSPAFSPTTVVTNPYGLRLLYFKVNSTDNRKYKVTLSNGDLPAHVISMWSGIPGTVQTSELASLSLIFNFVAPGTYPIKVYCQSDDGHYADTTFELKVLHISYANSGWSFDTYRKGALHTGDTNGHYPYTGAALHFNVLDSTEYLSNIALAYTDNDSTFYISGKDTSYYQVPLLVDMNKGTILMPQKTLQGRSVAGGRLRTFTVWGQGNIDYYKGTFAIFYNVSDGTGTANKRSYVVSGSMY